MEGTIIIVVLLAVLFVLFLASFRTVPEGYVMITEMLGIKWRILNHGPHFLIPFLERSKPLTWSTFANNNRGHRTTHLIPLFPQVLDPEPINATCKGRVVISCDTILRFRIEDPSIAAYSSLDIPADLYEQLRSALSDAVAKMTIDELTERPSSISDLIRPFISVWAKTLKIEILDILIQNLKYPKEIEAATHGQVARRIEAESAMAAQKNQNLLAKSKAEHERELREIENTARIQRAKAELEAAKLESEGTLARGNAIAEAEKRKLEALVKSGIPIPQDYLNTLRYSEAWTSLSNSNVQKVVIPYGAVPFLGSQGVVDVRQWNQIPFPQQQQQQQ